MGIMLKVLIFAFYISKTVAGWFGTSGVNSRKVQLKAPGKIKKFVKNRFGNKKDSKSEESDDAASATHKEEDEEDENEVEDTKM